MQQELTRPAALAAGGGVEVNARFLFCGGVIGILHFVLAGSQEHFRSHDRTEASDRLPAVQHVGCVRRHGQARSCLCPLLVVCCEQWREAVMSLSAELWWRGGGELSERHAGLGDRVVPRAACRKTLLPWPLRPRGGE